jgi:hypothetical protein
VTRALVAKLLAGDIDDEAGPEPDAAARKAT